MRRRVRVAGVAALAGAAGVAACRTVPVAGGDPPLVAIAEATARCAAALRDGPVDSVVAVFTPAGVLAVDGTAPVAGHAALRAAFARPAGAPRVVATELGVDTVEATGRDAARSTGRYALREQRGRYEARWVRDAGGRWRVARLAMHPAAAAP